MLNRIKIDLDRTLGTIDRNIFGGFVEHLGRCVYGGIYDPGVAAGRRGRPANRRPRRRSAAAAHQHPLPGRQLRVRLSLARRRRPGRGASRRAGPRLGRDRPEHLRHQRVHRRSAARSARSPTWSSTAATATCARHATGSSTATAPPTRRSSGCAPSTASRSRTASATGASATRWTAHWQVGFKTPAEYARTYHEFAKVDALGGPDDQAHRVGDLVLGG